MTTGELPQAAIAGIALIITLIAYLAATIILRHHWDKYELEAARRRKVRIAYFSGSAVIWILILISFIFIL